MLNFLAQEDQHVLQRASTLLQGKSTKINSKQRRRHPTRPARTQAHTLATAAAAAPSSPPLPEGFFPELGLSWRDPRRKQGRSWLRQQALNREQAHHLKILKVMRNVVYVPKKSSNVDIWTDPTINHRALDWYQKEQAALARGDVAPTPATKQINWFQQMALDNKQPTPRKKYIPPPPPGPKKPQHPRMLVPVPAVAAEPVAHIKSSKAVMHAVACREHYYKLFERTMLMSRAKGVQYLGGPNKLLQKYFELFGKILSESIKVGRAIEEWRHQLSLLTKGRIPFHKTSLPSIRPAFMWGGETISSKGHKRRYYKNYLIKMGEDLQCLIKTEIPAKMGKGSDVLINKAHISGDYVKGIEVSPLLINYSMEELLDASLPTHPCQLGAGLPSEQWYGCSKRDVLFIAKLMTEERAHVDVQGKLFVNPESVQGFEEMTLKERTRLITKHETTVQALIEDISKSSTFGPSIRSSVDAVGSVQLKVAKDLRKRYNSHLSRTFQ